MADPSEKSLEMGLFLESIAARTSSIHDNRCIPKPYGCGENVIGFRDQVSAREYRISGLCQTCQDKVFADVEEDEDDDDSESRGDLGYPGRYDEW